MQNEQKNNNEGGIPEGASEVVFIPTLHPGMKEHYEGKRQAPKVGVKKFTELTLQDVAEMTDEQIYQLSMPRPLHPEQRGFMWPWPDVASGKIKSETIVALLKRLGNIRAKEEGKK